ncbi:amino acid adenylation domain-containing protein, partial [Agrobacterium vitis]|nr:amino acid adenylation domain-containing protein [Agrobacterium vitis]
RRTTAERFATHFQNFLRAAISDPNQSIRRIKFLSEKEHQFIRELNATVSASAAQCSLHDRFREQVAARADRPAVVCENEELTYFQLDLHSDELARRLTRSGVKPGDLVGILASRGIETVIGFLGILKAGAAYVPLDPDHPNERLSYILSDSGVRHIVLPKGVQLEQEPQTITYIPVRNTDAGPDTDRPAVQKVEPNAAAYVIYTSGSTGRPKAVVIEHRHALRLFDELATKMRFGPHDVWSVFHSFAFDFSVWEMWGALLTGAKLVIVPRATIRNPLNLLQLVVAQKVTILSQTPSAFRRICEAIESFPSFPEENRLRYIVFGGETLWPLDLEPWWKACGHRAEIINMYGITEITVHGTIRKMTEADLEESHLSPIGARLPGLTLYLLDGDLQEVPIGIAGEIFVGGAGVARGYLGRPDLTAERFIANPYRKGDRLYRTGDRGRWRDDGQLLFLGRLDQQVKIRGHRIEPGEVEAALTRYDSIRQAAVLARAYGGDRAERLVAYLVLEPGAQLDSGAFRQFLANILPAYMIPSAFVSLPMLPLTVNGKLDKATLPDPEHRGKNENTPPSNDTERAVAKIWEKILNVSQVGVNDNFFDLGGHSLLAMQVVAQLQLSLNTSITAEMIFHCQTVAKLAERIDMENGAAPLKLLQPISYRSELQPCKATPGQARIFRQAAVLRDHVSENLSRIYKWSHQVDVSALGRALCLLQRQNDSLRMRFIERGDHVEMIASTRTSDLERISPSPIDERRLAACLETFCDESFDLINTGPFRCGYVTTSDGSFVLVLVFHHIAMDGWSINLVVQQLETLYEAERRSHLHASDTTLGFAGYARWLSRSEILEELDSQRDFWTSHLSNIPALPFGNRANILRDGLTVPERRFEHRLDSSRREAVRDIAKRAYSSPLAVFLTVTATLVANLSGVKKIVVLLAAANRRNASVASVVGRFYNYVAVKVDLDEGLSFIDQIVAVQSEMNGAYEHQEYPFEWLHEILAGDKSVFSHPIADVAMNYQTLELLPSFDGRSAARIPSPGTANLKRALNVGFVDSGAEITYNLRFDASRFSSEDATGADILWSRLLQEACARPAASLADIVASASEKKSLHFRNSEQ